MNPTQKNRSAYSKIRNSNRRAKSVGDNNEITIQGWIDSLEKFDNKCASCGTVDDIQIDHVVPMSLGGKNIDSNIQPLCGKCNRSKPKGFFGRRRKYGSLKVWIDPEAEKLLKTATKVQRRSRNWLINEAIRIVFGGKGNHGKEKVVLLGDSDSNSVAVIGDN